MSAKTGIAILGAGRWGTHLVRNFLNRPDAQLLAIVDPAPDRLETLRDRFEIAPEITLATDWSHVRQHPQLDAVAIATPASTHYDLISDALNLGYHVLAEKPLTLDPDRSDELCRLAQQQQRQLFVDHTYLFHPAVKRGQQAIAEGIIGTPRYGYATRTHLAPVRTDVDALWDLAIHDLAIFNTWLGQTPTQVEACGRTWLQPDADSLIGGNGLADLVWVTLRYPDGFEATIHLCWFNPDKQRRLGVVGTQGTLVFDEMQSDCPLTAYYGRMECQGDRWVPVGQHREAIEVEAAEPLRQMCDRFLDSVRSQQVSTVSSGWVGAKFVRILTAISESMRQGGCAINIL